MCGQSQALESTELNPNSTPFELCVLGNIIQPLWILFLISFPRQLCVMAMFLLATFFFHFKTCHGVYRFFSWLWLLLPFHGGDNFRAPAPGKRVSSDWTLLRANSTAEHWVIKTSKLSVALISSLLLFGGKGGDMVGVETRSQCVEQAGRELMKHLLSLPGTGVTDSISTPRSL